MNKIIHQQLPVAECNVARIGRFTIAQVKDEKGVEAVGISRRGERDKENEELGRNIAIGRAKRSLFNKMNNASIRYAFMG